MLETQPSDKSVQHFIDSVEHPRRKADAQTLLELFDRVTGAKAVLWGESLIGYGKYDYRYKSGHSGSWLITGFSPRKQNLVVYLMCGFEGMESLFAKLGKHKVGKSCVYINKLDDIDLNILAELVKVSIEKTLSVYSGEMV